MKTLKKKKYLLIFLVLSALFFLFSAFVLIRAFSPKQIDDVSPGISCDETLLHKADVYYVIPKFNNHSILENKSWCDHILSFNKTLELHGLTHSYKEFLTDRDEKYLDESIKIFQDCFNKTPDRFKAPQLAISKKNAQLVKVKMKLAGFFNQITHKVYHCSDTGSTKNWVIDLI